MSYLRVYLLITAVLDIILNALLSSLTYLHEWFRILILMKYLLGLLDKTMYANSISKLYLSVLLPNWFNSDP